MSGRSVIPFYETICTPHSAKATWNYLPDLSAQAFSCSAHSRTHRKTYHGIQIPPFSTGTPPTPLSSRFNPSILHQRDPHSALFEDQTGDRNRNSSSSPRLDPYGYGANWVGNGELQSCHAESMVFLRIYLSRGHFRALPEKAQQPPGQSESAFCIDI